jgi:hypothetical protein
MKLTNQNGSMKKGGLKGSFPKGSGGSVTTGLSTRAACDSSPDAEGMGTFGPNQMPLPTAKKKVGPFTIC